MGIKSEWITLGKLRRRLDNNIKVYVQILGYGLGTCG
jgi:hypothetical protein